MKHRIPIYQYVRPLKSAREQDYEIVQKILDGNQDLWDELYRTSHPAVLRSAAAADYRRMLNSAEYHEIADEAFARCYEQLDRYRGLSRFERWVGGYAKNITRNRCARELTRIRNRRLLEDAANRRMNGCDPLLILIRLERDRCLWRAFFDLSPVDRRIVWSSILENMAPKVWARELHLTKKEVRRRYEDALVVLRWNFNRYYSVYEAI